MNRRVAFYAPMKSPDHPNPSGDRRIARLLMKAFDRGGWEAVLASRLRAHQRDGNWIGQGYLFDEAVRIKHKLIQEYRKNPPAIWFTYHCYYKAPDLIGPDVAAALGIPYVVAEGYRSRKRLDGPYARFATLAEDALDQAKIIFHLTDRGLDALERDKPEGQRLVHLPPFTALGTDPEPKSADGPLKLLTVAMMRRGDKLKSYELLADALHDLQGEWELNIIGDGAARADVEELFASFGPRVTFRGLIDNRDDMRAAYEAADIFVWPGVNEAFGMVYLECQAAGTPCVAQDRAGVREVVGPSSKLTNPEDREGMAQALNEMAADRVALRDAGLRAREYVRSRHGINAASATITEAMESLL